MLNEQLIQETRQTGMGTPLKLAALFAITFLIVFIVGWVYDLFSEESQSQELRTAPAANLSVFKVDPIIEKELSKVLSSDGTNELSADLKDPFSDRSNLADFTPTASTLPIRESQLAQELAKAGTGTAGRASGSGAAGQKAAADAPKKINIAEETERRMRARDARIRAGRDPGPESAVFFIDDLLPVGVVSGGTKPAEVLMYSITMKRTYSFPAGAVFSDGWLATWRPDGVAFGFAAENGAIYLRPWSTNLTGDSDPGRVVIGTTRGS